MSIVDDVLFMFRDEIPGYLDKDWKKFLWNLILICLDHRAMTFMMH